VLDAVAPDVFLITETNVPHTDNVAYFGDGHNEAQLVYQFPLAPLVLNAYLSGSAKHLQEWAATLETPSPDTTFFNFLASHDGIGVVPASGILSADEIAALVEMTTRHGGLVSYKNNSDGTQSPYELNITFFDAISDPQTTPLPVAEDRFIGSQAIMLALAGMPGIYIHSLVGSSSNHAGVAQTGRARTINREKWQRTELDARIADPNNRAHRILRRYKALLRARAQSPAFDPQGRQVILPSDSALFAVLRVAPDGNECVVCVHNVGGEPRRLSLRLEDTLGWSPERFTDLIGGDKVVQSANGMTEFEVAPFGVQWLQGRKLSTDSGNGLNG
jgi:glucosylglycerate phosphorylase